MADWCASDYLLDALEMRFHGKDVFGVCTLGGEEYLVVKSHRSDRLGITPKGLVYQVLARPSWWPKWWYDSLGPKLKRVAQGPIQFLDAGGYPVIQVFSDLEKLGSKKRFTTTGILETWRLGRTSVYRILGEGAFQTGQ